MDIVAFGDHLRPNQDIQLMIPKSGKDRLGASRPACRIAVQTPDAGVRESAMEAITGQFYLGVIVAGLVSIIVANKSRE